MSTEANDPRRSPHGTRRQPWGAAVAQRVAARGVGSRYVSVVIRWSFVCHAVGTSACDDHCDASVEPVRWSTALAAQGAAVPDARPAFGARWGVVSNPRSSTTPCSNSVASTGGADGVALPTSIARSPTCEQPIPHPRRCYRECQDAVLHRLELAYAAFFRRVKAGETPGAPRFKSARRWNQLEFPDGDRAIKFDAAQRRMTISGVGSVNLRKGPVVPATFGRVFLVHKNDRWYAVFECHRAVEPLPETGQSVGIDLGIRALAALSTGELVANLRPGSRRSVATERCQLGLDAVTVKDARGRPMIGRDPRRRAAVRKLARAKEREANARRDWLHKCSRAIVDRFDVIALEDLRLKNMTRSAKGDAQEPGRNVKAKSGLNRALLDAGIGDAGDADSRESRVRCSHGDRRRSQALVARVLAVRARCGEQSCAESVSMRVVLVSV